MIKRYCDDNYLSEKNKYGRRAKTEQREDRIEEEDTLVRIAKQDRFKSLRNLVNEFNVESGKTISHTTVIQRLDSAGYKSNIAAHKPLKEKKRLEYAREHQTWTQSQ